MPSSTEQHPSSSKRPQQNGRHGGQAASHKAPTAVIVDAPPEPRQAETDPNHPLYWMNGEQAGGFVVPVGEHQGRLVRDAPWDWKYWALRNLSSPRTAALRIAIARWNSGYFSTIRDDWRTYPVPFGRGSRYYRHRLGDCPHGWKEFLVKKANESPAWAHKHKRFVVALKASLGLPADPDNPAPKPVDLNDPLFAPNGSDDELLPIGYKWVPKATAPPSTAALPDRRRDAPPSVSGALGKRKDRDEDGPAKGSGSRAKHLRRCLSEPIRCDTRFIR